MLVYPADIVRGSESFCKEISDPVVDVSRDELTRERLCILALWHS